MQFCIRLILIIYGFLLVFAAPLHAAVFNYPSSLINIPVYTPLNPGEAEIGFSTSIYSDAGVPSYEFDYMANLNLTDKFILGFTFVNSSQAVLNMHYNFLEAPDLWNMTVYGGIQNITQQMKLSSFDTHPNTMQDNNLSPYIGLSVKYFGVDAHVGIGKRRFEAQTTTASVTSILNGIFYGLDYEFFNGKIMMDFDGKNLNFGYRMFITNTWALNLGLTELGVATLTNPNYSYAPTRYLSLGMIIRENFFSYQQDYVKKQIEDSDKMLQSITQLKQELLSTKKEMDNELIDLRANKFKLLEDVASLKKAMKDENRFLYQKDESDKEEVRKKYLGVSSMLGEEVLKYYYESFEAYYQKDFYKAIELLSKAISIDPYVPMLYIRLGSIYYELEMGKEAMDNWQKALDLDPANKEIQTLMRKLKSGGTTKKSGQQR